MRTNAEGIKLVSDFEGFRPQVYRDSGGIPTIGYGSCFTPNGSRVTMDHGEITHETAISYLEFGLQTAEQAIGRLVSTPLTHNQFSALTSFVYNVGSGNFQRSTMRMKINRGSFVDASNEFWKWRRAAGRILKGLVRRREAERRLFTKKDI